MKVFGQVEFGEENLVRRRLVALTRTGFLQPGYGVAVVLGRRGVPMFRIEEKVRIRSVGRRQPFAGVKPARGLLQAEVLFQVVQELAAHEQAALGVP